MPPIDDSEFATHSKGLTSPGDVWVTVTPDDDAELDFLPRAISCGETPGTVVCVDKDGNEGPFYFNAGQDRVIRPVKILATGTTPGMTIIALK